MKERWASLIKTMRQGELGEKIRSANDAAADALIHADPVWVDILPAGEIVKGLGDYTVTHSGPPITYENMTDLHKRGMISACLLEGWAKTEEEAKALVESGKIKIISALDTNTVGSGTGIITKSVAMFVVKDRYNGTITGTFPASLMIKCTACTSSPAVMVIVTLPAFKPRTTPRLDTLATVESDEE